MLTVISKRYFKSYCFAKESSVHNTGHLVFSFEKEMSEFFLVFEMAVFSVNKATQDNKTEIQRGLTVRD